MRPDAQFAVNDCFKSITRHAAVAAVGAVAAVAASECAVVAVSVEDVSIAAFPAAWLTHCALRFYGLRLELAIRRRRAVGGARWRA